MARFQTLFLALGAVSAAHAEMQPLIEDPNAVVNVAFRDRCTGQETVFAPPNDEKPGLISRIFGIERLDQIELAVDLAGLTPGEPVELNVEVRPVSPLLSKRMKPLVLKKRLKPGAHTRIEWKKRLSDLGLTRIEAPFSISANVRWVQRINGLVKSHGGSASLAFLDNSNAFRVASDEICRWETPVSVASEYKVNNSNRSEVTFEREEELSSYAAKTAGLGVPLGAPLQYGVRPGLIGGPIGTNPSFLFVKNGLAGFWVFPQWYRSYAEGGTDALAQTWRLHPGDGGFMGSRFTFIRVAAEEYVPARAGRCLVWSKQREGTIDSGFVSTTLFSVPPSFAGDPTGAAAFMEKLHPAVNTCESRPDSNPLRIEVPKSDGLLFFTPR